MKTKEELNDMNTIKVRKEASLLNIKGYGKMDRVTMIEAILDAQIHPVIDVTEVFTDRHEKPLENGSPVHARVAGSSWFKGTVTKFKKIDDEQYVYVLLEGKEKDKMFHSTDVELDIAGKPVTTEINKPATKEVSKKTTPKAEIAADPVEPKTPEVPADKPAEPEIKKVVILGDIPNNGFPITKHHDKLKDIDLKGICKGDLVSFVVSKTSKVNPGATVIGKANSFIWDNQDESAYFGITIGDKVYYKRPNAVTKA